MQERKFTNRLSPSEALFLNHGHLRG
jgi:hypothetical protein